MAQLGPFTMKKEKKMNQANYESYIDPNGGEWIRLKAAAVKDVVWRPTDINMSEEGRIGFDVEFLTGPGTTLVTEENQDDVARYINAIMSDMIAYEQAQMEILKEESEREEARKEAVTQDELTSHIEGHLEGGHKVSEALLPQDIQMDLQQISDALGGLKPQ